MTILRLAHLSDPHLPPPPGAFGWRDLASKRLLSRIAWARKHHRHDPAVLAALVADVRAQGPDQVAVTGDLTNYASTAEIAAAADWLEGLGEPRTITVSPGNHDVLVAASRGAAAAAWAPWLGEGEGFPRRRRCGGAMVFNLCTAEPTAPHLASGRLGADQLDALEAGLAQAGSDGLARVLLLHHPPTDGAVSARKALKDRHALADVLRRQGAELVLHGHAHRALLGALAGPGGRVIPVLGAPSASASGLTGRGAGRWHLIELSAAAGGWTTRMTARGFDPAAGRFERLGAYVLTP